MNDRRTLLKAAAPLSLAAAAAACGPLAGIRSLLEPDDREQISVLADASLAPAVPALKADFERANPHVVLSFSLSSSGAIMKSILRGQRFDAVLLGGDTFGIPLVEAGRMQIGSMRPIASNWLVIATVRDSDLDVSNARDLLWDDVKRVGIADWEQSALGIYSHQALDNLGLWDALAPKRSRSKDERELAAKLNDGSVDVALLYSSSIADAADRFVIQAPVPEQVHRPIIYYVGIARETKYPITLSQFSKYLISQWGQRHFADAGYRMLTLR